MNTGTIEQWPIERLTSPSENWEIYRKITADDEATWHLVEGIKKEGILEPIVIDQEGVIVSGNRRTLAAKTAGLEHVPCRVLDMRYSELTHEERLRLLAKYNADQRKKSTEEEIREAIASVDEDDIAQHLQERQKKTWNKVNILDDENDVIPNQKAVRRDPSKRRSQFLDAIKQVIEAEAEFLPLSLRAVHYRLCNFSFLRDTSNPESLYRNDEPSYKALSRTLTDARVLGHVPWDAIFDQTRPVSAWETWRSVSGYLRDQTENMFANYWRDLMATQPMHVEIMVEKMTVLPMLKPIAMDYTIPILAARGYGSIDARNEMRVRYARSGKGHLLVLCVTDLDPEGVNIPEQLGGSLTDDLKIPREDFTIRRVALNPDQIERLNIPTSLEAKESSTRFKAFQDQYGGNAYELESLPTAELQNILRASIEQAIDMDAFTEEQESESKDRTKLIAAGKIARSAIMNFIE